MKDPIERQEAIDALDKHLRMADVPVSYPGIISALTEWLNELPPAQPETATVIMRHSIYGFTMWYACGACGVSIDYEDCYCRNCGRKLKHE